MTEKLRTSVRLSSKQARLQDVELEGTRGISRSGACLIQIAEPSIAFEWKALS